MRVIVAALCTALFASLALPATAARAASATVVYPLGDASLDAANVQQALNGGGTVLLKATNASGIPTVFDFGPSSFAGASVTMDVDVVLEGETTSAGAMSTIRGGFVPLSSGHGANVTIAGLRLDHPFRDAIDLFRAGSVRVLGNHIEHVIGMPVGPGFTVADGIAAGGGLDVTISDNLIDDVDGAISTGIEQFGARGRVEIARNRVTGVNTSGIETTQYVTIAGQGTSIHDNYVRPGPARYAIGGAGNGIEINGHGSFRVERNEVVCDNPNAICIFGLGFEQFRFGPLVGPVIQHNTIRLNTDPFGAVGIAFLAEVSQAFVAQNRMYGVGYAALYTAACRCEPASALDSNMFFANETGALRSGFVDVFFDAATRHATLVGRSGTVIDLGTDDVITGFSAVGANGGIGRRLGDTLPDRFAAQPQSGGPPSR